MKYFAENAAQDVGESRGRILRDGDPARHDVIHNLPRPLSAESEDIKKAPAKQAED
jgi:hypothetical protein